MSQNLVAALARFRPFSELPLRAVADASRILKDNYQDYTGDALVNIAAQEHVLMQLEILQTHPVVASRLVQGKLTLHGWMYKMEAGEVFAYDDTDGHFQPLAEEPMAAAQK